MEDVPLPLSHALLLSKRDSLEKALGKCRRLEISLGSAGPRLECLQQRLPSLEEPITRLRSCTRDSLEELGAEIEKAVAPSLALLKVFDAVHGLEKTLLQPGPQAELAAYISLTTQLEDAFGFLSEHCETALQWLKDSVEALAEKHVDNERIQAIHCLAKLSGGKLDGEGLLDAALGKLVEEFNMILSQNGRSCSIMLDDSIAVSKLQMIVSRLASTRFQKECLDSFVRIRASYVETNMASLDLDYLRLTETETETSSSNSSSSSSSSSGRLEWKPFEKHIVEWTQHMEVITRLVFEPEFDLCCQILAPLGLDVVESCFARLADCGEIAKFLAFGEVACRTRNEPRKLFKLLDMFEAITNLRPTFAKIFGGPSCKGIQTRSRALIKHVVLYACQILAELRQQVELQRDALPPSDGTIPRVSSFVVGYLIHLAGDFYAPIIEQVLAIECSWKSPSCSGGEGGIEERLLQKAGRGIIQALESNLLPWAKHMDGEVAFHLFLMNNFWYLHTSCKGSAELRSLAGEPWLKQTQQQAEEQSRLYIKQGWGSVTRHLEASESDDRNLLRAHLTAFNSALEDLHRCHARFCILDPELRQRICIRVVKAVVPIYQSFVQRYGSMFNADHHTMKFSAQRLEQMVTALFRPDNILNGDGNIANGSSSVRRSAMVKVQ